MEMTYLTNEIKQRASDKIASMYLACVLKTDDKDPYWSIDSERAEAFKKRDLMDVDVYNYILTLIEKDRT
jgi:hypothetical protein